MALLLLQGIEPQMDAHAEQLASQADASCQKLVP